MDKRPLILRTLITLVVVAVFASAIHPLFERDYYVTFLGLLVKPASPEEARKVQGGKRMRPALLILMARAMGADPAKAAYLGAVIEILHTATLMHDDVVDEGKMRRGRETANARWGNGTAVLVGDFFYRSEERRVGKECRSRWSPYH